VTFLGQRQQQFKLVDQKAASLLRFGNEYHARRLKLAKSRLKKRPHA
jgi:hypothetical protein